MIFQFIKSSYQKLKNALAKTRSLLGDKIRALFGAKIDEETLDELEKLLYESDLGVHAATELTDKVKKAYAKDPQMSVEDIMELLRQEMLHSLSGQSHDLIAVPKEEGPLVILIVGVNGNGKTTSVAKLAKKFTDDKQKVLIAAADTFRAAAIEQLEVWAQRLNVDIVKGAPKADPAAVVFDAMSAGKSRQSDVVILDTAGRLHTKIDLMNELEKIKRSCRKFSPNSPHETLLVLDATTGQNAIDQAKVFHKYTPITGLILTKLDGTAKGGIILSIQKQLGIPVKFIGIGEGIDDLEPFNPEAFVTALFE